MLVSAIKVSFTAMHVLQFLNLMFTIQNMLALSETNILGHSMTRKKDV
mgnify:CR=1 FL=1